MAQLSKEIIEFAASGNLEGYKDFIEMVCSDVECKEIFIEALARKLDSLDLAQAYDTSMEYENEDEDEDEDDDDEDEEE